ncbi:MAG: hypothetical protein NTY61_02185 [Candidatus Parcubacteria bacterium]|nr:hypothetical protein [Candidatus Parcubacteria bacterium]
MSPERWEQLKGELKDKYPDIEEESGEGEEEPGSFEILTFTTPMGKIKLEYLTRPVILDKKTATSRRIGSTVAVKYIYSDNEVRHTLIVWKLNEATGEWEELKANLFA